MDIQRGKISFLGAASIILLSSGMIIHVIDIPIILELAGRDAWISILIAAPLYLLWLILLTKFVKYLNGQSLIEWIKQKWGKLGYALFTALMVSLLFFNCAHTMLDTMIWTVSTYLQNTPTFVICACILFISLAIALNGLQSLTVTAAILFPIVTFLGFFVATSNDKFKDFTLLLPILEHGLQPPLIGAFYAFTSLCDSLFFIFVAHEIKKPVSYKKTIGFGLYLIMIFTGPIIGGITEFGIVEATAQRYSVFDQWKILGVGRFLQHVDFLSIFQWLSGTVIRMAFSIYVIRDLLSIHTKKRKIRFTIIITVALFLTKLVDWRADTMLNILKDYYFPILFVIVIFLSAAFFVTSLFSRSKHGTPSHIDQQIEQAGELDEKSNPPK